MKVILLQDVRHTGHRGEIIEVKPGFARNFLLPQKMAALATGGNLKLFEQQRSKIEERHVVERTSAVERSAALMDLRIEIPKRASESQNLYGSVTPAEIEEALAARGIEVDRRTLDLAGGIKTLGEHKVRVHLHPEVTAEITVNVVAEI
jgi:large subunit ribosomal protein L9